MDFLIDFSKFLLFYVIGISIVIQYGMVLRMFFNEEWNTKKEFLLHLIPFYPHCYLLKDFTIDVKNMAKEAWKKLK